MRKLAQYQRIRKEIARAGRNCVLNARGEGARIERWRMCCIEVVANKLYRGGYQPRNFSLH